MKIQKKIIFFFGGGCRTGCGVRMDVNKELKFLKKIQKEKLGGGSGWGGQGGCERRIEVFVKIQRKKIWGGGGSGGGVGLGGVRVDVNEELKFL